MKANIGLILLASLIGFSFTTNKIVKDEKNWIAIDWVKELDGDFSFKEDWSYAEGIYKNNFGQLSCDWYCPPEVDGMKDEQGRILEDSLAAFYEIIDTTHIPHSINSTVMSYEYSGVNIINFKKDGKAVVGQTIFNVSTHSNLNIRIYKNLFSANIYFNSIRDLGIHTFLMETGQLKIDKKLYKKGIIKAAFNLTFTNTLDAAQELYWKGFIYSEIKA